MSAEKLMGGEFLRLPLALLIAGGASALCGAELGFEPAVIETTIGIEGTRDVRMGIEDHQLGREVLIDKMSQAYFVARANALEDHVHIYHTVKGRRVPFDGVDVNVAGGQWHTLPVEFSGPNFRVCLDGQKVLTAKDDTVTEPGMVGVWIKADSVTAFDDFRDGEKSP